MMIIMLHVVIVCNSVVVMGCRRHDNKMIKCESLKKVKEKGRRRRNKKGIKYPNLLIMPLDSSYLGCIIPFSILTNNTDPVTK